MNKYLNKNSILIIISFIVGGLFMYFLLRFTPLVRTIISKIVKLSISVIVLLYLQQTYLTNSNSFFLHLQNLFVYLNYF